MHTFTYKYICVYVRVNTQKPIFALKHSKINMVTQSKIRFLTSVSTETLKKIIDFLKVWTTQNNTKSNVWVLQDEFLNKLYFQIHFSRQKPLKIITWMLFWRRNLSLRTTITRDTIFKYNWKTRIPFGVGGKWISLMNAISASPKKNNKGQIDFLWQGLSRHS